MIDETKLRKLLFPTKEDKFYGIKLSLEYFNKMIKKCRKDEEN